MFLIRSLLWLTRRIGEATVLALLLLVIALGSMLHGLSSVIRGFDLWFIIPLIAAGLLAGWGLAKLPLPGWLAGLIALAIGSEVVIIRLGRLASPLLTLPRILFDLLRELPARSIADPLDLNPMLAQLDGLWSSVYTLFARLFDWLGALISGQPAHDPLVTAFIWSLVLWSVAVWTAWMVRRQARPLLALTPAGGLLAGVLAHSRESTTPLLFFLGAALLLVALVRHQTKERHWHANQVSFSPEIRTDLAVASVSISVVLVVIAASAPLFSLRNVTQFTSNLFRDHVIPGDEVAARALGLEISLEPSTPLDAIRRGGLPRNHLLGSGPELSEQVVMVIRTNDPPPLLPDEAPPRYYWRSITYDRYNGRGWLTRQTETIDYEAGEAITSAGEALASPGAAVAPTTGPGQRLFRQEVRLSENISGLLYAAGELVAADQPFSVAWRSNGDIFGTTTEALSYLAESRLPDVTPAELRAAGSDYPAWVRRRYLALPASVPNRVLTLARDLTATAPTPYDRAKAIEQHLRAFPYTLDLPAPPPDRDIADYFLFDLQQGYCDYYATSMVVLARAAGLPARMAVGYINGTYDRANHRYVVSEAEAHSWVEVYFPGSGWITFEPTGGRPAIERGEQTAPIVPPELEAQSPSPAPLREEARGGAGWWLIPAAGLVLLLLAFTTWSTFDAWRLRRLAPALTVTALQQRLYRHAQRLHTPTSAGDTPYEFAFSVIEQINNLATRKRWGQYLIQAPQEIETLIHLYVRARYSPHHLDPADQIEAIRLWQKLRRRLWLAWLVRRQTADDR